MAIYKMVGDKERLEVVPETTLGEENVREVEDLQRLLLKHSEVLEPGLLIIRVEFSEWNDSRRRIDLLALDKKARLVVVELKRGQTGEHSELQAIRYAAMVANLTFDKVVDTYQAYFGVSEDEARSQIHSHLEIDEGQEAVIYTERPRIILACEDFGKELTTSVLWLNSCELDIKCIRLKPYRVGEEVLIETSQIIPLPEAHDYLVKVKAREEELSRTSIGGQWQFNEGGQLFQQRIASAKAEDTVRLGTFYEWASNLEKEGLAKLSTTNPRGKCNLLVALPVGHNPSLVRVRMEDSDFRCRPDYIASHAPKSIARLEELIGTKIEGRNNSFSIGFEKVDEALLAALTQAYREANGLPLGEEVKED